MGRFMTFGEAFEQVKRKGHAASSVESRGSNSRSVSRREQRVASALFVRGESFRSCALEGNDYRAFL